MSTLAKMMAVRSQTTQSLIAYLTTMQSLPQREASPFLAGGDVSAMYVMPEVLKAHSSKAGASLPKTASRNDEAYGRFSGEDGEDGRERRCWDRELEKIKRAAILGRPGEGKSLLTRMSVRRIAQASLDALQEQKESVAEVAVPIWVHLANVAEHGLAASIEAGVRRLMQSWPLEFGDRVLQHLLAALPTERAWLFLDALDETPVPGRLKDALAALVQARCHILVTSRPYGYEPGYLPFALDATYELAPLKPVQRRWFIANWFLDDTLRCQRTLELIQGNSNFGNLTTNALLLTLTCAVSEQHILDPATTRRVDLYELMLRDMLRGAWKHEAVLSEDDPHVTIMLKLLERVAWRLFSDHPERRLLAEEVLFEALTEEGVKLLEMESIMVELKKVGLLVWASPGQWMFLHRTFHEFLAARYVSQLKHPIKAISPFLVQMDRMFGPPWQTSKGEMICLLAGCLRDPKPLIDELIKLDREKKNLYRPILLLAGRCVSNLSPAQQKTAPQTEWLATETEAFLWNHEFLWRWASMVEVRLALGHQAGVRLLIDRLACNDNNQKRCIVASLGRIGSEVAVGPLIDLLEKDRDMRSSAARALIAIGSEKAVPILIELVRSNNSADVVYYAFDALGGIGGEAAECFLIEILRSHPWRFFRWRAYCGLAEMGSMTELLQWSASFFGIEGLPGIKEQ